MIIISCGRKIKVKNGTKTQTVNIYTNDMIHGQYDYIVRVSGVNNFVNGREIEDKSFKKINELIEYLKEYHYGIVEKSPQNKSFENYNGYKTGNIRTPKHTEFGKDSWIKEAIPESERIVNNFLKKFIDFPYLHRVEHSIHCDLYNMLISNDIFNKKIKLADQTIQILHKEWPEYIPRENKNNRRGNFDMAILSPESIKNKGINDFIYGRIEAPIVIEMGLNYRVDHFIEDFKKLKNSNVFRGYLIHLVRKEEVDDNDSIELPLLEIEKQYDSIKVGYVRHLYSSVRFKLINDKRISIVDND